MDLHTEQHRLSSEKIRDFVIGMSDGLTVPFALAAGLSGAMITTNIIVTAGLAEIAAGSIAMGLGGYMAAKTEAEHYDSELKREYEEVEIFPDVEKNEVAEVLENFGVPQESIPIVVEAISKDKKKWVDFMMRFELGLERPEASRKFWSPTIIGSAYILGGLVPLLPYMMTSDVHGALIDSCITTLIALILFGAFKGHFTGTPKLKSAVNTTLIGSAAAITAYAIAKLFS